jgi:hypothetical protein
MVVFKNPRDVSQIMALAHQMYPQRTKYFLEAYTAATSQPHGYMVIETMDPRHEMIGIVSVWNVKCVRIVGFQNIIGFFFITLLLRRRLWRISLSAAVAYIPLSAAAEYIPLSAAAAADTHHCSVDTDELFHAYFLYVST